VGLPNLLFILGGFQAYYRHRRLELRWPPEWERLSFV